MDGEQVEQMLERRLRQPANRWRPAAPPELRDFLDRVPREHVRRHRLVVLHGVRRRAFFALAAAAAVVVAVVASVALIGVRSHPETAGASLSVRDGWAWQRVDAPPLPGADPSTGVTTVVHVANGYIGTCGTPTLGVLSDVHVCSSPDGANWTSPPDRAILAVEGGDPSSWGMLTDVVGYGGILLASVLDQDEGNGSVVSLWRSTDGVHWSRPDVSSLPDGFGSSSLARLPDAFAIDTNVDGTIRFYTSKDGLSWSPGADAPLAGLQSYTITWSDAALFAWNLELGSGGTGWSTRDARTWTPLTVEGGEAFYGAVSAPGGGYAAIVADRDRGVLRSSDGLVWRLDPAAPAGYPWRVLAAGGRVVLDVSSEPNGSGSHALWQLTAAGAAWQPLLDPSGAQASGTLSCYQTEGLRAGGCYHDRLAVSRTAGRVDWVFMPAHGATALPPRPTARPTILPTLSPTATPVLVTPGPSSAAVAPESWTWKATDGTVLGTSIAVGGGYVAVCGGHAPTSGLEGARLCSSKDGISWSDPADPAMLEVGGGGSFWPIDAVQHGGVYLAFALDRPIPSIGETEASLWRSTDGRRWEKVASPAFAGLRLRDAGIVGDGFGAVATSADGRSGMAFVSADGLAWRLAGTVPGERPAAVGISAGRFCSDSSYPSSGLPATWISDDGSEWTATALPDGVRSGACSALRISDGSYVGLGLRPGERNVLMRSEDGISWRADASTPDGQPYSLQLVGERLVLVVSARLDYQSDYEAWSSADGGRTWRPIGGPDGFFVLSIPSTLGQYLAVHPSGAADLTYLGEPPGR